MKCEEAIENYINGNYSDFKKYVKRMRKSTMLHIIELAVGQYGVKRHAIIATMQNMLEDK